MKLIGTIVTPGGGAGKVAAEPPACETCDGTGIGACPDVAEYVEIPGGCPRCGGSGKAPAVAR